MNTYEHTQFDFICFKLKAALLAWACYAKTDPKLQKLLVLSPLPHMGWGAGFLKKHYPTSGCSCPSLLAAPSTWAAGPGQQHPGREASTGAGCLAPHKQGGKRPTRAVDTTMRAVDTTMRAVTEPKLKKDIGSLDWKKNHRTKPVQ